MAYWSIDYAICGTPLKSAQRILVSLIRTLFSGWHDIAESALPEDLLSAIERSWAFTLVIQVGLQIIEFSFDIFTSDKWKDTRMKK